MLRYKTFLLALTFSTMCYGQTGSPVFLKWKLQPKEVITYKTIMEDIDGTEFDLTIDLGDLSSLFADSTNKKLNDVKKAFSSINKSFDDYDFITTLEERRKGLIDVELSLKKKDSSKSGNELAELMRKGSGDVMLRGALTEEGTIQSFYLKNDQKNLIALMFELPGRPVSIGDKWSLDVNLISMDQNFKCDSSLRRNVVTLIDIKPDGGDKIAVMKYDVFEYVHGEFNVPFAKKPSETEMKMSFNGIAEFSLNRGRWVNFDGILLLQASGVMNSNTIKKLTLQAN